MFLCSEFSKLKCLGLFGFRTLAAHLEVDGSISVGSKSDSYSCDFHLGHSYKGSGIPMKLRAGSL